MTDNPLVLLQNFGCVAYQQRVWKVGDLEALVGVGQ